MSGEPIIIKKIAIALAMTIFIALFLTGCLADPVAPYYSSNNDRQDQLDSTLTVTGNGSSKVLPDKTMINIAVFTEDDTSGEAVNKNGKTTADMISALEDLEIDDLEIQTISFNLDPLYNYRRENEPPEVYGYRAATVMEVSTTEIDMAGEIIAEAIKAGANDVSSLRFGLSQELERQAKKTALERAAEDGRNKAEDIAGSLNVEIVEIYYISESEIYVPSPPGARTAAVEESLADVSAVPITPDEIEVTASVNISYIFRQ
jgi:uncharacterized protein